MGSIEEVFEAVERGCVEVGVVPVENAIEGGVTPTLDKLADSRVYAIEERVIPIHLALLSDDPDMASIQEICSHPQALGQCREWLMKNLPHARLYPWESTAQAAKMAKSRKGVAAVASTLAAELYGLRVLRENIEDVAFNQTRFFIVGKDMAPKSGNDKTSVLIKIKDESGALFRMIQPFAMRGINLTKIESRPSRSEPFSYVFFVDFLGHIQDDSIQEVIRELSSVTLGLKVLGSYPRA
jgi:chorismate mutase/prephenate dehydratase